MTYKYDLRGVSATKDEVHAAIKHLDKGIYPNAFCKVLPDLVAGDEAWCNLMHADTAGTKTALAYLRWRETGNTDLWKGIAQDAIVMNVDDMACTGAIDNIILSSTIGRNKNLIPGEVLKAVIDGATEFVENMREHGVNMFSSGGETADVGDIVRTIDVGYTTFARLRRDEVIQNNIKPGAIIVGLASYGQAIYEKTYNSGMGSNGLTSARHDVLNSYYADNFPDSFDANTPREVVYCGSRRFDDVFEGYSVEQLILSPTRTYLPVLKAIFEQGLKSQIQGIIHCSGGGQTKVEKFLHQAEVVKNNLLPIPPVFRLIQSEGNTAWREMYQVFNMGVRLECYVETEQAAQEIISIAKAFNIDAQITGYVTPHEKSCVRVQSEHGEFTY